MSKINLSSNAESLTTTVSNVFIDYYMPHANGSYVKVYLYLLRCLSSQIEDFSISFLADHLENTETDIIRALKYWEKVGLLKLIEDDSHAIASIIITNPISNNPFIVSTQTDIPSTKSFPQVETTKQSVSVKQVTPFEIPERPSYTSTQISQLSDNDEIRWIMNIIELYLERPLKPKDVQLILYLYESVGFSAELIMYLYEYCISKGKKSSSYIETVAISWAQQGINTVEQAEEASSLFNSHHLAVRKAFALNRSPGTIEKQYIDKWINSYHFSIEIILEACNRTLLNTQKADFKYADRILESWLKKGVKSPDDIKRLDTEFNASKTQKIQTDNQSNAGQNVQTKPANHRFNAFPQRNYTKEDYANLERRLLNRG